MIMNISIKTLSAIIPSSQIRSMVSQVSPVSSFVAHVRVWSFKKEHCTSCFKAPSPTTPEPLVTPISGLISSESQTTETSEGIMVLTLAVNL